MNRATALRSQRSKEQRQIPWVSKKVTEKETIEPQPLSHIEGKNKAQPLGHREEKNRATAPRSQRRKEQRLSP
uniref:Uncharacterized protein n=1 Tax=Timema monikensis TaxID=170555 RepID=A0A7R9HUY9_9NEOP|nr:unnamed protein product [Timema monikensis]